MKGCNDMREFLETLEEFGELATVKTQVDTRNFELAAMLRLNEHGPNKAILFNKVKGYGIPVISNLYGSIHRLALGVGIHPTDEQIAKLAKDPRGTTSWAMGGRSMYRFTGYAMTERERAEMILVKEELRAAEAKADEGKPFTKLVSTGPCKEVIIKDKIDVLGTLPVVWHNDKDAGPYINPGALVQRDPDTRVLNTGVRRHLVEHERYGKDKIGAFIVERTDGGRILAKYEERGQRCEVALCIGINPFVEICANYTSPHMIAGKTYNEFDIAGAWMGRPLEMVKCETVDLEVPADTEIVIEGYIPPGERIYEGPMAEYTDYYAYQGPTHFIQVTAITMRKNPIYHTLICGHTQEDLYLGAISSFGYEQQGMKRVQAAFPNVKAIANHAGSFGFHTVVSFKPRFAGEDRLLLNFILATSSYSKYITIVDEDIDPYN
ncbi:MAG: UbiD family decarboxylase, partial [Dehalococcoidia bacterium]|nr:UbiD family decarboxylase [Dehalococcoidia bacterium]